MSESFNPYHRWLGIPPKRQPPNHYRLLGIELFEDDIEVLRDAGDRQMSHVKTYQLSKHKDLSQKMLNELGEARACLSNPVSKADYDTKLRAEIKSKTVPPRPLAAPPIQRKAPPPSLTRSQELKPTDQPRQVPEIGAAVALPFYSIGCAMIWLVHAADRLIHQHH